MLERSDARLSVGKRIASLLLALALSALHPFCLEIQALLPMPSVGFTTMAAVALFAWAGTAPTLVFFCAAITSNCLFFQSALGLITLPMNLLPGIVLVLGIRRRDAFFTQMYRAVIAFLAGSAVTVILIGLVYGNQAIGQAFDLLRADSQRIISQARDAFSAALDENSATFFTYEEFESLYNNQLDLLQLYYEQYLIANLLSGSILTAAVSVLWSNWLLARRGEATPQSFIGICDWYLPSNVSFGLIMMLVVSFAMLLTGLPSAPTVYIIVTQIATVVFDIQAFAALDRRAKANGANRGRRTARVLLTVFLLIPALSIVGVQLMSILAFVGCASALFGRKGAVRPALDKIKDKMNGNDR